MSKSLTHFDSKGDAHMVDVSSKDNTDRIAIAKGNVSMKRETFDIMTEGKAKKGDVLSIARIAGIMGCKKTSELIPLCHPIPLSNVKINLIPNIDLPGVEMEALTAVSIASLTIYDMLKAVDKTMQIGRIRLTLKEGGKSGRVENP
jgi:cyclic pyranopterin phosphate synthase